MNLDEKIQKVAEDLSYQRSAVRKLRALREELLKEFGKSNSGLDEQINKMEAEEKRLKECLDELKNLADSK